MPEIIVKLGDRLIHRYYFDKDVLSIGRARDNDIVIENLSVSRNHARIKKQDGKFLLVDMNSSNGTMVNGVRVTKTEVVHDDLITIGKHTMHFINQDAPDQVLEISEASSSRISAEAAAQQPQHYDAEGVIGILEVTKGKQQSQQFKVYKAQTSLGRAPVNDVRIHDWLVSNRHAAIHRRGDKYFLEDLGSWRGTEINGEPVKKETPLKEGDVIVVGTTMLTFGKGDAASVKSYVPVDRAEDEGASPLPSPPPEADELNDEELDSVHLESAAFPSAATGDEFAPFTDEELEALEAEADSVDHDEDEERQHHRELWEMTEAEKMFERGEEDPARGSLLEDDGELTAEEEAAVGGFNPHVTPRPVSVDDLEAVEEEIEEEEGLYGGPMGDNPPYGSNEPEVRAGSAPAAAKPKAAGEAVQSDEVRMWEKALRNKSVIIRKNAAKELKRLTGKDYDWQSEPSGN